VDTYSARMLAGLFSKDPETIAGSFSPDASNCEDMASGVRLINFYLNHTAKGMRASRKRCLENARKLLSARLDQAFRAREIEQRKIALFRRMECARASQSNNVDGKIPKA
jgi:hypothetical protein